MEKGGPSGLYYYYYCYYYYSKIGKLIPNFLYQNSEIYLQLRVKKINYLAGRL